MGKVKSKDRFFQIPPIREPPTDIELLRGWAGRIEELLSLEKAPTRQWAFVFRPDRMSHTAMMRLSIRFSHVVKQVDDCLAFADKWYGEFGQCGFNPDTVSADNFASAVETLGERIKAAVKVIEQSRTATPDTKTDNGKNTQPDNVDVADLCRHLKKRVPKGEKQIDIAREFTRKDEAKAKSLLRQAHRYKHLWQ